MAVIEYNIQVDKDNKTTVTYKVVQVDEGDRIRFKSNNAKAAIKYQKDTPFSGTGVPEADKVFKVGKGPTPDFKVAKTLTGKTGLHFDCGALQASLAKPSDTPAFYSWGTGEDTPPGHTE